MLILKICLILSSQNLLSLKVDKYGDFSSASSKQTGTWPLQHLTREISGSVHVSLAKKLVGMPQMSVRAFIDE